MNTVPFLTTDQMREVDRAMIEDYHIELVQMMENAGRNLAHLARMRFLAGDPREKQVVVLCGPGGNGGGGLVCARHLHNWGAIVTVATTRPSDEYSGVPAHQLDIVRRLPLPVTYAGVPPQTDTVNLILDAVIGYSLSGAPTGVASDQIRWAGSQDAPILSLDVPSGVDTSTGCVFDPAIRATATLTLALPKAGLRDGRARDAVGELYLGDISVPPDLYRKPNIGISVDPLFAREEIIRLW